mmetsp:Transcript_76186/g.166251  ORF Transcript_76186/g.166251 Transcript_76186/m.166251 type:complete len:517 (+) Transcript_76186:243-1793(+)
MAVAQWNEVLWRKCPVTCGICAPEKLWSNAELLLECQDDPALASWCSKWSGFDCAAWPQEVHLTSYSSASEFSATLFGRCPRSCGLCSKPICNRGTYRDAVLHTCEACPIGQFSPLVELADEVSTCVPARPGYYAPNQTAIEDIPCKKGSFSSSSGAAVCELCESGHFASTEASTGCKACPAGTYQGGQGSSNCLRCPLGSYQNKVGQTACKACPAHSSTTLSGSISESACICSPKFYYLPRGARGTCMPCPNGFFCAGGAGLLNFSTSSSGVDPTIWLLPGLMSDSSYPLSVYSCLGNDNVCPEYRQPGHGGVCTGLRSGLRCGFCPSDFYVTEEGCKECPSVGSGEMLRTAIAFLIVIWGIGRVFMTITLRPDRFQAVVSAFLQFLQFLLAVKYLPIDYSYAFRQFIRVVGVFDIFAFVDTFVGLPDDCLFESDVVSIGWRDALSPCILPFLLLLAVVYLKYTSKTTVALALCITTAAEIYGMVFVQISAVASNFALKPASSQAFLLISNGSVP